MKQMISCIVTIMWVLGASPLTSHAQDASNFNEPGTGALKQVKTAVDAARDAEKPPEKKEELSSVPLNTSTGSAKQTVSQMSNRPEVAWVYHSKEDAPKSLFAKSYAERMQEGSLRGPVSNPPAVDTSSDQLGAVNENLTADTASSGPVTGAELSTADTANEPSLSVSADTDSSTSTDSPSGSVSPTSSEPAPGSVTQSANTSTTDKPASQSDTTASPTDGFDQKTLDLLPAAIFEANVSGGGQMAGQTVLAGPAVMMGPREVGAVKSETDPQSVRGMASEEGARRMGQRGSAVEKLAGGPSKGGSSKSGLLSGSQSTQTGWFDTLQSRVNRGNVSDMKEREGEADQKCVSFADTDGIAKMIEKSAERAGLSEDQPKVLYAYGQDAGNIVFITVVQLDNSGQPKKAARLFADGRVQAFGQLAKQDILGKVFGGEPVPPNEVLFTKKSYRILGVLTSETISQFFLDQSRTAARGPCPKAFNKK